MTSEEALEAFFKSLNVPMEDLEHRGLDMQATPARVAKMYRDDLLSAYKPGAYDDLDSRFTVFDTLEDDSMITMGPIEFSSLCSHHFLPFVGVAYVGYIPGEKLIGASKIPRVVEFYSRMAQIQERMATQVADFVLEHAGAVAVLVLIRAKHLCMSCRGVRKYSEMVTTAVRPKQALFENREAITEFYSQISLLGGH